MNLTFLRTVFCTLVLCTACIASEDVAETNTVVNAPLKPLTTTEEGGDDRDSAYDQMEILSEAILHIRKRYIEEKSFEEITYGALHGMLHSLDPHSSFLEADEYSSMQDDTAGRFSGIGIHIGLRNGILTVIAPIEDTPAFDAGLQSGDQILAVDGEKTMGMTLRDAVKRLRGEKGSSVTITVRGEDAESERDLTIVREDIVVPSVKGTRMLPNGIGYVRITQFAAPTADSLADALTSLATNELNGLVLDLRSNPGGLLRSAVDVAGQFLPSDVLVVSTHGREGVMEEIRNQTPHAGLVPDMPVAVLINGGSASASEIVAGALKDHHRAVLVGTQTYGKASVQRLIPLGEEGKAAIRLTIAQYLTPNGAEIHDKGIAPDILVPVPPDEWRRIQIRRAHIENPAHFTEEELAEMQDVVDRQLERAVDALHAINLFRAARP